MCGILGWTGRQTVSPSSLDTMLDLLGHRGPDDRHQIFGHGWGLGFRRLKILDLSERARQPMSSHHGRYWLVFNGEIYNYQELKHEQEEQGEQFQSTSDTEVLLKLLVREGTTALDKLNGMFAFCFLDTESRTFLLARDRLGVKPLCYTFQAGQLRFASELKALLAWPEARREIAHNALNQYLALNYLPHETCIFKGYHKLAPGQYLQGSLDEPEHARLHSYWQLDLNGQDNNGEITFTNLEELEKLLTDAVRIRLRSDVPLGLFLSGGIDSGLVTTLAGKNETAPLALTVSFCEKDYDESELARSTATAAGLDHRVIPLPAASLSQIDRLAWFYDEPFADASALPTYNLCRAAAEHATVFLSGDGGDEAFAGYRRYIEALHYSWLGRLPEWSRMIARQAASLLPQLSPWRYKLLKAAAPHKGYAAAFDGLPEEPLLDYIRHPDLEAEAKETGRPLWDRWRTFSHACLTARQQALDYNLYLPDDILVKMDRASMANSIEVRSPFLDYRLVEWAARLPRQSLLDKNQGKLPLRKLAEKLLPPRVQQARKQGFAVPLDHWFREPTGITFLKERLLSPEASRRHWWDTARVKTIVDRHQSRCGRDFSGMLWRLLMLDAWARQYHDSTNFLHGPQGGGFLPQRTQRAQRNNWGGWNTMNSGSGIE